MCKNLFKQDQTAERNQFIWEQTQAKEMLQQQEAQAAQQAAANAALMAQQQEALRVAQEAAAAATAEQTRLIRAQIGDKAQPRLLQTAPDVAARRKTLSRRSLYMERASADSTGGASGLAFAA